MAAFARGFDGEKNGIIRRAVAQFARARRIAHFRAQWVLKEQHSHQTFGQWCRNQSDDGQSGLPPTALGHVSATERSPMSPPRLWVSVGTIHDQNASGWHLAIGVVERVIRQLIIIGISHRIGASWPLEPTRDA